MSWTVCKMLMGMKTTICVKIIRIPHGRETFMLLTNSRMSLCPRKSLFIFYFFIISSDRSLHILNLSDQHGFRLQSLRAGELCHSLDAHLVQMPPAEQRPVCLIVITEQGRPAGEAASLALKTAAWRKAALIVKAVLPQQDRLCVQSGSL